MGANVHIVPGADEFSYYFRNFDYNTMLSDLPTLSLLLENDLKRLFYKDYFGEAFKIMIDASEDTNLADGVVMITSDGGKANVSDITDTELSALEGINSNIQEQIDAIDLAVGVFSTAEELQARHDEGYTTFAQKNGSHGISYVSGYITGEVTFNSASDGTIIDYQFLGNFNFRNFQIKNNDLGGRPSSLIFNGRILFEENFIIDDRGILSEINFIQGDNKDTAIFSGAEVLYLNYVSNLTFNVTNATTMGSYDNISTNSTVDITTVGHNNDAIGITEIFEVGDLADANKVGVVSESTLFHKANKVPTATENNITAFTADGDIKDSGVAVFGMRRIINGFTTDASIVDVLTSNILITYQDNNDTGTNRPQVTVQARDGVTDIEFFSNKKRLIIPASTPLVWVGDSVPTGEHWIGIDDAGVMGIVSSPDQIRKYCATFLLNWDDNLKMKIWANPQPHGHMDEATHEVRHFTEGSKRRLGYDELRINNFTFSNGSDNTHAQFGRKTGHYYDEDLLFTLPEVPVITAPAYYIDSRGLPILGVQVGYTFLNAPSGRPYYNKVNETTGAGELLEIPDTNYFIVVSFAVGNCLGTGIQDIVMVPRAHYETLHDARLACKQEVHHFKQGWSILREIPAIGVEIFQTSNEFTNDVKARLLPYSTELDSIQQDYFDSRYPEMMEMPPQRQGVTEDEVWVNDWQYQSSGAWWGSWSTDNATLGSSTVFSLHQTSQDGANNKAFIEDTFLTGLKLGLHTASGDTLSFTLNSAPSYNATTKQFSWDITDVVLVGTFDELELTSINYVTETSVTGTDDVTNQSGVVGETASDALNTLNSTSHDPVTVATVSALELTGQQLDIKVGETIGKVGNKLDVLPNLYADKVHEHVEADITNFSGILDTGDGIDYTGKLMVARQGAITPHGTSGNDFIIGVGLPDGKVQLGGVVEMYLENHTGSSIYITKGTGVFRYLSGTYAYGKVLSSGGADPINGNTQYGQAFLGRVVEVYGTLDAYSATPVTVKVVWEYLPLITDDLKLDKTNGTSTNLKTTNTPAEILALGDEGLASNGSVNSSVDTFGTDVTGTGGSSLDGFLDWFEAQRQAQISFIFEVLSTTMLIAIIAEGAKRPLRPVRGCVTDYSSGDSYPILINTTGEISSRVLLPVGTTYEMSLLYVTI